MIIPFSSGVRSPLNIPFVSLSLLIGDVISSSFVNLSWHFFRILGRWKHPMCLKQNLKGLKIKDTIGSMRMWWTEIFISSKFSLRESGLGNFPLSFSSSDRDGRALMIVVKELSTLTSVFSKSSENSFVLYFCKSFFLSF